MEFKDKTIAQSKEKEVNITLKNNSESEQAAKKLLETILNKYPLDKWIFSREVMIEEGVRSHSHPVITLNTRRIDNEERHLSLFLHEQIHWVEREGHSSMDSAIEDLKAIFPDGPVGRPEGGDNIQSTYRHLVICRLEFLALAELLGEDRAKENVLSNKGYLWMYRMAMERGSDIDLVIQKYFPDALA